MKWRRSLDAYELRMQAQAPDRSDYSGCELAVEFKLIRRDLLSTVCSIPDRLQRRSIGVLFPVTARQKTFF